MSDRYRQSEQMLERALRTIPVGSQTFSKSKIQYPHGVSPYFIKKAKGSHVWDADGNEYIDYVNGLAAITLGYGDPDVDAAVRRQLEDGVVFSLPHPLEFQVAEKIKEMVPCAEMVRFGKNGSDATSGAIRVARAYTGRDHILVCGYHGWQDWYIGATVRNKGVPRATRDLTHTFEYNNISSLVTWFEKYPGQVAAVILEPMNFVAPENNFLEEVRRITHQNGALLVFDETVTGFRYSNGGAQEYFKVIPDLATFGKGLANGYPVSAVAGRAEVMKQMEEVFYSFTFGGETLSLAAALAAMTKIQKEPVVKRLFDSGKKLMIGTQQLIERFGLKSALTLGGLPCWHSLVFKDAASYSQWQIKTYFMQEIFARGVLTYGTHNMSYAHSDLDIEKTLDVYREVFQLIQQALEKKDLEKQLRCQVLEPLFKIR